MTTQLCVGSWIPQNLGFPRLFNRQFCRLNVSNNQRKYQETLLCIVFQWDLMKNLVQLSPGRFPEHRGTRSTRTSPGGEYQFQSGHFFRNRLFHKMLIYQKENDFHTFLISESILILMYAAPHILSSVPSWKWMVRSFGWAPLEKPAQNSDFRWNLEFRQLSGRRMRGVMFFWPRTNMSAIILRCS